MLQRFIAITWITCGIGLLTACGDTVRSNSSTPFNPSQTPSPNLSSNTENSLQLQFPTPPSAEMKNELKQEKYQLQQDDRDTVEK